MIINTFLFTIFYSHMIFTKVRMNECRTQRAIFLPSRDISTALRGFAFFFRSCIALICLSIKPATFFLFSHDFNVCLPLWSADVISARGHGHAGSGNPAGVSGSQPFLWLLYLFATSFFI